MLFCHGDTLESMHVPSDAQSLPKQSIPDPHPLLRSSPEAIDLLQINLAFSLGESLSDLEDRIINDVLQ